MIEIQFPISRLRRKLSCHEQAQSKTKDMRGVLVHCVPFITFLCAPSQGRIHTLQQQPLGLMTFYWIHLVATLEIGEQGDKSGSQGIHSLDPSWGQSVWVSQLLLSTAPTLPCFHHYSVLCFLRTFAITVPLYQARVLQCPLWFSYNLPTP